MAVRAEISLLLSKVGLGALQAPLPPALCKAAGVNGWADIDTAIPEAEPTTFGFFMGGFNEFGKLDGAEHDSDNESCSSEEEDTVSSASEDYDETEFHRGEDWAEDLLRKPKETAPEETPTDDKKKRKKRDRATSPRSARSDMGSGDSGVSGPRSRGIR